ncbi:hypothetical protein A0H81_06061 [Grifola frondosa]|uniref:Uncharacterized protein n=1 Tax=Grifola frondosa TaxID=5627 RepID=A0A1C7MAT8_GRIFR|nr:hypothetical protein A0H81_06061 [Grifola frondosa]
MSGSVDQDRQLKQLSISSQSSGDSATLAYMASDQDSDHDHDRRPPSPPRVSSSASPPANNRPLERPNAPHRASTVGSPRDLDQKRAKSDDHPHARSEDLNHTTYQNGNDLQHSGQL